MLVGDSLYAPLTPAGTTSPSVPAFAGMRAFRPIHIGDFPPFVFFVLVVDTHTVEDYHNAFVYRVDTNTPEPRPQKTKKMQVIDTESPEEAVSRQEVLDALFEEKRVDGEDRLSALDFLFKYAKIEEKKHGWD